MQQLTLGRAIVYQLCYSTCNGVEGIAAHGDEITKLEDECSVYSNIGFTYKHVEMY